MDRFPPNTIRSHSLTYIWFDPARLGMSNEKPFLFRTCWAMPKAIDSIPSSTCVPASSETSTMSDGIPSGFSFPPIDRLVATASNLDSLTSLSRSFRHGLRTWSASFASWTTFLFFLVMAAPPPAPPPPAAAPRPAAPPRREAAAAGAALAAAVTFCTTSSSSPSELMIS